jgi:hypothetical protein
MNEIELFKLFEDFLINQKGYPKNNLLFNPPIANKSGGIRIRLDLIVLDDKNNYLALFEFKNNIDSFRKNQVKNQINAYKKYLGNNEIFCFLIYPNGEHDFNILRLNEINEWEIIEKDSFPTFERLKSENVIINDIFQEITNEEEFTKEKEIEKLYKKRIQNILFSSLIALISSLIIYYSSNIFYQNDDIIKEKQLKNEIQLQLKKLKLKIEDYKVDTIYIDKVNNENIITFDKRLKIIENGLINSPEKVLELNKLNQEIANLNQKIISKNEVTELKFENLNNKLEWLFALVIGLLIGLLTSAIGYIFSIIKLKKE